MAGLLMVWALSTMGGTLYLLCALKALIIALQFQYKAEEAKLEEEQPDDC